MMPSALTSSKATPLQMGPDGRLRHLLSIEGLSRELVEQILSQAESFLTVAHQSVRKVPLLRGRTVANLFFEPSTRTRMTFELAATRLSADVLNPDMSQSATRKGEGMLDTLRNMEAMQIDLFVVRHSLSGAAHFLAQHASDHVSILNAGDGSHAHPTQALLDAFTMRKHFGSLDQLVVTIVGDILYSRVARSQIQLLRLLGVRDLRLAGPPTLMPTAIESWGCRVCGSLEEALEGAHVIMMLRLQRERICGAVLPSTKEYYRLYGLNEHKMSLAHPDAIVMHPGPINRGVEIASSVADGPHSLILPQVSNGIAIRMAVMAMVASPDA